MFFRFVGWLARKLFAVTLIVAVALAIYSVWLFRQEDGLLEKDRVVRLEQAIVKREELTHEEIAIEKRLEDGRKELAVQQERSRQADKVIANLRELESWWDRWWPWSDARAQQSANADQLKKMEQVRADAHAKANELQHTVARALAEKTVADDALRVANLEVAEVEASRSRVRLYLLGAWEKTRWYLLAALILYFIAPVWWRRRKRPAQSS